MSIIISMLLACGGDTAETTEVVNTTATVTDDGIEVVETTTETTITENGTTTETTETISNIENTATTNDNE